MAYGDAIWEPRSQIHLAAVSNVMSCLSDSRRAVSGEGTDFADDDVLFVHRPDGEVCGVNVLH
jgi:hypothetical protein